MVNPVGIIEVGVLGVIVFVGARWIVKSATKKNVREVVKEEIEAYNNQKRQ